MIRRPTSRNDLSLWLARSLRQNAGLWGKYAVAVALVSLGQGAMAWTVGALVKALTAGQIGLALRPAVLGAVAALVKVGGSVLVAQGEVAIPRRLGEQLRDRSLEALLAGQPRQGADDVFRILGAIRAVELAVGGGALGGVKALLALLTLAGVVVALVPGAALVVVLGLLPLSLGLGRLRRSLHKDEARGLHLTAELEHQVDSLIRHADLWRVAGSGTTVRRWVAHLGEQARQAHGSVRARRAALSSFNEALAALVILALVAAAARGHEVLPTGELLTVVTLGALAYRPLRDWGEARGVWAAGQEALRWLAPWLEVPGPSLAGRAPASAPPSQAPGWSLEPLVAEGFGARRHGARWDVRIEPGALVLVVGPNGSGKTTLLRCLLGLEPSVGRLRYGALDLEGRGVGPEERPMGWAPQEAPVLSATLEQNVALGGVGSIEQAREVLGEAWGEVPGGQRVGEGGRALSGGERAWVGVARACAGGMPVLLLDEPTASLDAGAEARMVRLLQGMRGRRTMIVVTHRVDAWTEVDAVLAVEPARGGVGAAG